MKKNELRWRKMSEEMPKLNNENILCYGFDELHNERPVFLRRIKPRPVPLSLLHEKLCRDNKNDNQWNKYHGWELGCCFEFARRSIPEDYEDFSDKELTKFFFLKKELIFWMPIELPKTPEDSAKYAERVENYCIRFGLLDEQPF